MTQAAAAQLDLFLDSRAVILTNEIGAALLLWDCERAFALLQEARADELEHPDLPALAALTQALSDWRLPEAELSAIADAVAHLKREVVPNASAALGPQATQLIRQLFQQLSAVAHGLSYDPSWPSAHRAALCLCAGDFIGAEQAAEAIPNAMRSPDALCWLTLARHRLRGLEAARATLFFLAWCDPARMQALLEKLADELLDRDWRAFEIASEWESLAAEQLPAWFPAWYLMEHPAAAAGLDPVAFPDAPAAEAARLMVRLLDLEKEGNSRALAATRERLRGLNVEFFDLYMIRRRTTYG